RYLVMRLSFSSVQLPPKDCPPFIFDSNLFRFLFSHAYLNAIAPYMGAQGKLRPSCRSGRWRGTDNWMAAATSHNVAGSNVDLTKAPPTAGAWLRLHLVKRPKRRSGQAVPLTLG